PEPPIKPETRVVHIEEDPWEIGKVFPVDVGIVADSKSALGSLIEVLPRFSDRFNGSRRAERIECLKKAKAAAQAELQERIRDGSTMFGIQGLWTLAKYRIPLVVIVFNNRAYMAVKNQFRGPEEKIRIAAELGAALVGPDLNFARLADCFGIFSQRVEQPEQI